VFDYGSISHPFGLGTGDLALLSGGIALVFAVLFLGLSGNKRGRRWLAGIGWLALMLSVGALGYGTMHGGASRGSHAPA